MGTNLLIEELRQAGASIGDNVFFGPDVYAEVEFAPLLTIESGVVLARGVSLILHDSGLNNVTGAPLRFGRIILRENCYVGANSTVLCDVEIGSRALIGAASLVNRSVPADHVAFGAPARVRGTVAEFLARHDKIRPSAKGFLALPPWRERRSPADQDAAETLISDFIHKLASDDVSGLEHQSMDPQIGDLPDSIGSNPSQPESHDSSESGKSARENPQVFFSLDEDDGVVTGILAQIDRNLTLRPLLTGATGLGDQGSVNPLSPALPDVQGINWRISELQRLHSLVYVTETGSVSRYAKQAVNPLIKLVSRKQILFNRELIDLLTQLALQVPALQQLVDTINLLRASDTEFERRLSQLEQPTPQPSSSFQEDLEALRSEVTELRSSQTLANEASSAHQAWLERLTADKASHDHWLKTLTQDKESHDHWLHRLTALVNENERKAAHNLGNSGQPGSAMASQPNQGHIDKLNNELRGLSLWMTALNNRVLDMAKQQRDSSDYQATAVIEPRIVNPDDYSRKILEAEGALRVNLGAGDKPWVGYINVDARELPDIDVVADVARLPYVKGQLTEIASAHVIEHFREHYLRGTLLPYWRELLRPGGILRITCPDWSGMLARLQSGKMSWDTFKLLTFGGQDYAGNDHFAMYTPFTLKSVLEAEGFVNIQVVATDRMNDICPEMELISERP